MALHEQCTGATDEWYTPRHIFDALGCHFDMDVASPGGDVTWWLPALVFLTRDSLRGLREGGKYAAGLSMEGFAGGYLQALDDIDGALTHGHPSDHRGYWREAERRSKSL